jgi:hypothetical protein
MQARIGPSCPACLTNAWQPAKNAWRERDCEFLAAAPPEVLDEVRAKLKPLLGI